MADHLLLLLLSFQMLGVGLWFFVTLSHPRCDGLFYLRLIPPSAFLYFLFIRTMTGKFAFGTHLPSLLLFVLCACNAVLYGDKNEIQRKSCNVESLFLVLITSERIIIQSTTSLKQRFRGNFGRSCILKSR